MVVPAGAGAGRPADQPGLTAAGPVETDPGTALGVEGQRGDQRGVGGGTAGEVEQVRLGRRGAGTGRGRRERMDGGGVLSGERHGDRPEGVREGARTATAAQRRAAATARREGRISRTDDTRSPHSGRGPYGPSATGAHRCRSRSGVDHVRPRRSIGVRIADDGHQLSTRMTGPELRRPVRTDDGAPRSSAGSRAEQSTHRADRLSADDLRRPPPAASADQTLTRTSPHQPPPARLSLHARPQHQPPSAARTRPALRLAGPRLAPAPGPASRAAVGRGVQLRGAVPRRRRRPGARRGVPAGRCGRGRPGSPRRPAVRHPRAAPSPPRPGGA